MGSIVFAAAFAGSATGFDASVIVTAVIWLGVLFAAVFVEGMTSDMVSIWFAPGALVAMVLAVLSVPVPIQIVVFLALSAILLVLAKTVFKKHLAKYHRVQRTNADALVGQRAMVEEDISNRAEAGVVKINGQLWSARMENDTDTAAAGQHVEIVRVAGSKLICRLLP